MIKEKIESLISKLRNPQRVEVEYYKNKYPLILSAERTNDTLDWFHVNSSLLETLLQKEGLSWCYIFETAPKKAPCIYMFIGEGLIKEELIEFMQDDIESLPEERNFYYEDDSFSSIDVDLYDGSITELEKELTRKASDVFRVYEP